MLLFYLQYIGDKYHKLILNISGVHQCRVNKLIRSFIENIILVSHDQSLCVQTRSILADR